MPVNVIGYGPSATVNVSKFPVKNTLFSSTHMMLSTIESDTMMSSTATITEQVTMCDVVATSSALTVLSVITVTASFATTRDHEPCVTKALNSLSTDGETISVAIGVPIITGLITGVISAFITSIIVYCIMKRRRIKTMEVAQEGPVYDIPIVSAEQKPNPIGTHFNAAYGQVNI
ncbi:PREDICTED: uncharacterized protein LOC109585150 [Amphimedon queenslandica]|nr:PREDICTED: uncharacterized protein LOC109585150 [Amphimedon queenslandica]|eukprot:XP_019856678.1 PREDICTED: uncharacterized protein LOC109585150 [Amphimedon queenslandica]